MVQPKVSIIMPVYNAEKELPSTLKSIYHQTFSDFEVIFIDDGSTDCSYDVLMQAAKHDSRIKLLQQPHKGAGAARNCALSHAKGYYVIFSDCDDVYQPNTLDVLYTHAAANDADIVTCNYAGLTKTTVQKQFAIRRNVLPADCTVFNFQDCPEDILRIAGPMVWNKLYKRDFIDRNGLQFDEYFSCNDLSFVAVSMACAERISFTEEHLIHYHFPRLNNVKSPKDSAKAISSALTQLNALPNRDKIQSAIVRFGIESYINSLKKNVKNFSAEESKYLYTEAHLFFLRKECMEFTPDCLHNSTLYREFCTVQKHVYETMCQLRKPKVIVSLTSYPKRIGTVKSVIDTILTQTKRADRIILWLAEEQFPEKEDDLPKDLVELSTQGLLDICWCDDLKPHKKYFYAFQKYPDDLIITVDDDILYPPHTISTLYASYLLYPDAVSAARAHIIAINDNNEIMPYNNWIHEVNSLLHSPSMQLIATGCGGILYRPSLFRKAFFDKEAIISTCLHADDLWLKAMQVISNVPVVLAKNYEPLQYVPSSQEEALFQFNIREQQNDVQLKRIIQWTDAKFGANALLDKLVHPVNDVKFISLEYLLTLVERERRVARNHHILSESTLASTKVALSEAENKNHSLNAKIEATQAQLTKSSTELTHAQHQITELTIRFNKVMQQLQKSEEINHIRYLLQKLKKGFARQQDSSKFSVSLLAKYSIYYLAWIPEKMLEVMMYYLQNGATQTLKQICRKLFRRGQ